MFKLIIIIIVTITLENVSSCPGHTPLLHEIGIPEGTFELLKTLQLVRHATESENRRLKGHFETGRWRGTLLFCITLSADGWAVVLQKIISVVIIR